MLYTFLLILWVRHARLQNVRVRSENKKGAQTTRLGRPEKVRKLICRHLVEQKFGFDNRFVVSRVRDRERHDFIDTDPLTHAEVTQTLEYSPSCRRTASLTFQSCLNLNGNFGNAEQSVCK